MSKLKKSQRYIKSNYKKQKINEVLDKINLVKIMGLLKHNLYIEQPILVYWYIDILILNNKHYLLNVALFSSKFEKTETLHDGNYNRALLSSLILAIKLTVNNFCWAIEDYSSIKIWILFYYSCNQLLIQNTLFK